MRIACCVPHCKRTVKASGFNEWICGKHWPLICKEYRRAYTRSARRSKAINAPSGWWQYPAGSEQRLEAVRLHENTLRLWKRMKREAIEKAFGI